MLKNFFAKRFATFANDRVMPNDGKNEYGRYQRPFSPESRKTLSVRWLKRHGVTDPLGILCVAITFRCPPVSSNPIHLFTYSLIRRIPSHTNHTNLNSQDSPKRIALRVID